MRRFQLNRIVDHSDTSGTGIVAEGVVFSDGKVAMRWVTGLPRSVVIWDSMGDAIEIHSHGGDTEFVFLDP